MDRVVERILVHTPDGAYPIFLGGGLQDLSPLSELLEGQTVSSNCAVITNSTIGALYAARVVESLHTIGFQAHVIEIPDGEQYKTLDTLRDLYDRLIDADMDRHSIVFALGGGVVGDVAGFAAATFLRGTPLVQLPTTLLAMVDSSIGGKVGVDHARGKNLIGAFKQPLAVIADIDTLKTLPEEEFHCGMAEVVKHGMIGDKELFEELQNAERRLKIDEWLGRAIRVKVDMIVRDPYEKGDRAKLNLGHTFGHALEKVSDYKIRHGEAVAIGLVCATRLAARRKLCDGDLVDRVEGLLRAIGLPTHVPSEFSADEIFDAMQTDKKRLNARLRFILPHDLGNVVLVDDVERGEILRTLHDASDA